MMKQEPHVHRRALWLLLAAAALPATPLLAQDQPVADPTATIPPVTLPDPVVTQPVVTQPPASQPLPTVTRTPSPSATTPTPITEAPAAPERRTTTRTTRTTASRAATPPRAQAPARVSAPATAAAPAAATAAPAAETAAPAPALEAAPAPLPVPAETSDSGPSIWMFIIGGALLLLAAFAALQMLRHRRRRAEEPNEVYQESPMVYEEPAALAAAPAAALAAPGIDERRTVEPVPVVDGSQDVMLASAQLHEAAAEAVEEPVALAEDLAVAEADPADVEALAASSMAPDGRPWLEFMMRPVRAGTSKDAAVVEFELTVGNTGTVTARDVRISTFMFAAGSAQESEMERMLIDPPADSAVSEGDIGAGDATRVDGSMALPRAGFTDEAVLPVVVADARYRLPDGSEGRTRASFEVGIPSAEGLDPFPMDRTSGLLEGIEARLHGEPERV